MKYEISSYNTKKTFAEALKELMMEKPLSKITVSELIKVCGVNRKTFYYHFEDIYALLKWMFEEEAIEVVKHFDLMVDHEEAITFVMDYVEQNNYIINCAYDSIGHDEMKRFFYRDFTSVVTKMIEGAERQMDRTLSPEYRQFLCNFYTEALSGAIIDWVKKREQLSRSQVIDYVTRTIRGSLKGILLEPQ